jgi:RNA 3'-terminal phosphate cyclase (ATP)
MSDLVQIDGSKGEGGGQILRTSLSLSVLTGRRFEIVNVRAGRKTPGLLRQHLTAVKAAREVCDGSMTGAFEGSTSLIFAPGPVRPREFHFMIGTAGSATLVLQTVLVPLMVAGEPSRVIIEGGTHNMAAPPWEYITDCYLPIIRRMGPGFSHAIHSYGFFPAGGGRVEVNIEPVSSLRALSLIERGGKAKASVRALVSRLPLSVGERECRVIRKNAQWQESQCEAIEIKNSPGPGNVVMIRLDYPELTEIFTGFGKRGVSAENVAEEAWDEAESYREITAPVGPHLCDQLMLPCAVAAMHGETSQFVTGPMTQHALSQIDTIRQFLELGIRVEKTLQSTWRVTFEPVK